MTDTMTSKQRVLATIKNEPVDKIPVHHIQFSMHAGSVILGRPAAIGGGGLRWAELNAIWEGNGDEFDAQAEQDAIEVAKACGHDILRLTYWRWWKHIKPFKKLDDGSILAGDPDGDWWKFSYRPAIELMIREDGDNIVAAPKVDPFSITEDYLHGLIEAEEQIQAKTPIAPDQKRIDKSTKDCEAFGDYILKQGSETVFVNMEVAEELTAAALWPDTFRRLLELRADRYIQQIKDIAAGGQLINFSGMDICTETAPSISPDLFRQVVLPPLKRLVDATHEMGMHYIYGGDGNFWPLADIMFNELGINGWFETDKSSSMELKPLREKYPNVTFIGNIPVQVLHCGTKDDAIRETMQALEVAHELGGVIVGCSNMIMPGTPPENILAMMDCIEKNR